MEKLIYVGPEIMVLYTGLGHGGGWHEVQIKLPLYALAANLTFIENPKGVVMTCKIGEPVGGPVDLVDLHAALSFIMQNYQALSDAVVGAYKNGFLEYEF